jgi:hypothetical protein
MSSAAIGAGSPLDGRARGMGAGTGGTAAWTDGATGAGGGGKSGPGPAGIDASAGDEAGGGV